MIAMTRDSIDALRGPVYLFASDPTYGRARAALDALMPAYRAMTDSGPDSGQAMRQDFLPRLEAWNDKVNESAWYLIKYVHQDSETVNEAPALYADMLTALDYLDRTRADFEFQRREDEKDFGAGNAFGAFELLDELRDVTPGETKRDIGIAGIGFGVIVIIAALVLLRR